MAGTGDLADLVFEVRQRKRVVAYISDLAASAAYYVASQANQIFANPAAIVGSIGVFTWVVDWSRAFDAAGLRMHVIRSGQFKGIGVPGDEVTEEQRAELQRLVEALHRQFVAAVARGRNLPADQVRGMSDGRVFVGSEAARVGLVDAISSFDRVIHAVAPPPSALELAAARREEEQQKALQRWRTRFRAGFPE